MQKRVGELERGKARVWCEKIKGIVWGLLFVQDLAKRKEEES